MSVTFDATTTDRRRPGVQYLDAPTQVAILGALWFAYAAVRNLVSDTRRTALANASRLLELEATLGVDIERSLQVAIEGPEAFVAANVYYLVHFPVTAAVATFAFWRSRSVAFTVLRNSIIASTSVALIIHLVIPMAPPRMLPGFDDTGAVFGPDPYAIAGGDSANQFAALPSMHVAWAVLVGYVIWQLFSSRILRGIAIVHPILTMFVVVVTGHHFVADVALGAALAVIALRVAAPRRPRILRCADDGIDERTHEDRYSAPGSRMGSAFPRADRDGPSRGARWV